eukprot:291392-Pelagomonas_calceolata.AAC.3
MHVWFAFRTRAQQLSQTTGMALLCCEIGMEHAQATLQFSCIFVQAAWAWDQASKLPCACISLPKRSSNLLSDACKRTSITSYLPLRIAVRNLLATPKQGCKTVGISTLMPVFMLALAASQHALNLHVYWGVESHAQTHMHGCMLA